VLGIQNFLATPKIGTSHGDIVDDVIPSFPIIQTSSSTDQKKTNNNSSNNRTSLVRGRNKIGIFVAANERGQELYDSNLQSIICYGHRHGYDVIITNDLNSTVLQITTSNNILQLDLLVKDIDDDDNEQSVSDKKKDYRCQYITGYSFQRQCVVLHVLPYYDFLVVLDADVGVANANVTIESILQRASTPILSSSTTFKIPHIIHEQRFHTGEIMAASYIVQNTQFAKAYLQRWNDYYYKLPNPEPVGGDRPNNNKLTNKFYHNHRDNPSLNIIFLETLGQIVSSTKQQQRQQSITTATTGMNQYQPLVDECHNLWKQARGNKRYMGYLGCIQRGIHQIMSDCKKKFNGNDDSAKQQNNNDKGNLDDQIKSIMYPLYLFRQGHGGLGRDINTCNGKVTSIDLFVHNLKEHSSIIQHAAGFFTERPSCDSGNKNNRDWQSPIPSDRWLTIGEMKNLMNTPACLARSTNIGGCWPNCTIV
jgi:hypothetical protein